MITLILGHIAEAAPLRKPGYVEAIMKASMYPGGNVINISSDDYAKIRQEYAVPEINSILALAKTWPPVGAWLLSRIEALASEMGDDKLIETWEFIKSNTPAYPWKSDLDEAFSAWKITRPETAVLEVQS